MRDSGTLIINDSERFEVDGHVFTSGDMITVEHEGSWVTSRIECKQGEYYIIGIPGGYEGMEVKKDW